MGGPSDMCAEATTFDRLSGVIEPAMRVRTKTHKAVQIELRRSGGRSRTSDCRQITNAELPSITCY